MPPPKLARDTPIADVLHPIEIVAREALRRELDQTFVDHTERLAGNRLAVVVLLIDGHEPLQADQRLNDRVAAFAVADAVRVRLNLDQMAPFVQIADDRLAAFEAVHPNIRPGVLAHGAVFFYRVDHRQLVALANLEVDRVVAGRHLQRATAERPIDDIVGDDRQLPLDNRQDGLLANERSIAFVVRMYGDCGVGDDRLRPGRRDRDRSVPVRERIGEVPQAALLVPMLHFQVRDRCLAAGAPVDQALATIDQAFLVQLVKDRPHGFRRAFVHREALARPIGGRA